MENALLVIALAFGRASLAGADVETLRATCGAPAARPPCPESGLAVLMLYLF